MVERCKYNKRFLIDASVPYSGGYINVVDTVALVQFQFVTAADMVRGNETRAPMGALGMGS